jgi:hypothetical protein
MSESERDEIDLQTHDEMRCEWLGSTSEEPEPEGTTAEAASK